MNKKGMANWVLLIIFAVAVGLVAVGALGSSGGGSGSGDDASDGDLVNFACDIVIDETLTSANLKTVNCVVTGKSRFCPRLLGFFEQEGEVMVLDYDGIIDAKDFDTGIFGGEDEVTLKGCTRAEELDIRLEDEDGNLLDSETVRLY